ncbi:unannotated protein [freshwater metagenome]|uniref:Unannotated protein n=1 Tax=freshwater metagenome TaxID=449393 RepID=A0A6J7D697_9ZZZZ
MNSTQIMSLAAIVIAALALIFALYSQVKFSRLRRELDLLQGPDDQSTFVATVARHIDHVDALREDIVVQRQVISQLQTDLRDAIRHVAVVRYDAFGDMGGRYSFSLALLDDDGDGLVLSAIHARADTRAYFKGVTGGASDEPLSPEELRAVALARGQDA